MDVITPSILHRIVKDSLSVFPDDAHLRVLAFFEGKHVGEDSLKLLKAAWAKAVLSHDAFGRSKRQSVDPEVFFNDFVEELIRNFSDGSALRKLADSIRQTEADLQGLDFSDSATDHQQNSLLSLINTLDSSKAFIQQYISALYAMPVDLMTLTDEQQTHDLDALVQYQEVVRKLKPVWKRVDSKSAHVRPVSGEVLFDHTYRFGRLVSGLDDVKDPPLFCSSVEAVGLEIPNDHSSAADSCWTSFGFLHDFICCRQFDLFPKPLVVTHVEDTFSTIFTFESPSCRPLNGLLSVDLAVQLRKHPSILTVWCTQLSLAAQALTHTVGHLTAHPSLACDVLVRDDGMLLVGGVSFSECAASHSNLAVFTPLIYQLLSTVLCLSRTEIFALPQVVHFQSAGLAFDHPEAVFTKPPEEGSCAAQQYTIATRSTLGVEIASGAVADVTIMPLNKAYQHSAEGLQRSAELDHYYSVLVIVTSWTPSGSKGKDVAPKVTSRMHTDNAKNVFALLEVCSAYPGTLIVECTALIPNHFNMKTSERRLGCIQVTVLDMPSAEAVDVQELIGYIEERYVWKMDNAIFQSSLFQRARDLMYDDKNSKELMIQCAGDWATVKRVLFSRVSTIH